MDLDDDYGPNVPPTHHVDPSHLTALAQRVANLADLVGSVQRVSDQHGKRIDNVEQEVARADAEIENIIKDVGAHLTAEETKFLRLLLEGKRHQKWARGVLKYWIVAAAATIGGIWALKDPITWFFAQLARLLR